MNIRIIGCGSMGTAFARVMHESGKTISLYDKHLERAQILANDLQVPYVLRPLDDITSGDVLLLAVKPQDFNEVAAETKEFEDGLLVSMLSSISVERLKQAYPRCFVLRMMPNLAVRYGDGIVALAEDPQLETHKQKIEETFAPLGMLRWLAEKNFDAVTSLCGSGPAFFFAMIEAMVDAAVNMGLTADLGYELVKQMLGGSMTMLYEACELPAELRLKVCSPAGTTIAGLRTLEQHGVRSAIIETFYSAYERSKSLSTHQL